MISIHKVTRTLTPEEIKENIRIEQLRVYLGLYWELDYSSEDIALPSNYDSMQKYESDKEYAEDCIYNNKDIPEALIQKLATARKDLEARGIIR